MPLINALLFMVLAGVGLAGYVLSKHFEKMEENRYLDWCESTSTPTPEPPLRLHISEQTSKRGRLEKAG